MGNKLYIILRNALRGFENLRLVLTKRCKAYVTMIGKPCDSFKPYDSVNQDNRKFRRKC